MARRRMIDPNIWMSEDVSRLSVIERLLLIGMFSNADDYGKGRANPAFLRSTVFPYDDIPIGDIERGLVNISNYIEIVFYEIEGSQYYRFTNWEKWQTVQKPQESKIPDPVENDSRMSTEQVENEYSPKEKKRKEIEDKGKEDNTAADAAECDESIPAEKSSDGQEVEEDDGAQSKTGKDGYTADFETFWDRYPRHVEKKTAFKVWKTRLKEKTKSEDMIQAAVNYAAQCQREGTETRYIKHASTFIGPNKPFEEYIKGPPEPPDPGGGEPVSWGPLRQLYAEYEAEERSNST